MVLGRCVLTASVPDWQIFLPFIINAVVFYDGECKYIYHQVFILVSSDHGNCCLFYLFVSLQGIQSNT